jgi:hypothetical protein
MLLLVKNQLDIPEVNSSHGHPRVMSRMDQHGTRKTAILVMANRIICVKIASASLAMEIHNDRHELTEGQVALACAVPLAVLEQALEIEGLKPLAKVVNIAEHGDELPHRDLLWFRLRVATQPPYAGPYGLARLSHLSRIQVKEISG